MVTPNLSHHQKSRSSAVRAATSTRSGSSQQPLGFDEVDPTFALVRMASYCHRIRIHDDTNHIPTVYIWSTLGHRQLPPSPHLAPAPRIEAVKRRVLTPDGVEEVLVVLTKPSLAAFSAVGVAFEACGIGRQ